MGNRNCSGQHHTTGTEPDNLRVWDGHKRGHYEVWYITLNHRDSGTGYWIRYTLESPQEGHGEPYAQLWFAHFHRSEPGRTFAINRRFPIEEMDAKIDPFALSIGDAVLTHQSAGGSLAGNGHKVRWDFSWIPGQKTHRHLPTVMYQRGGLGDTTVLTPNLNVQLSGEIEVDGVTHKLSGDPGGQTHLWGKKHAHTWAWGHCSSFKGSRQAALETLTVRLKKRGLVTPPLTIFTLYLDGEIYRYNEFHHTLLTSGHLYIRLASGHDTLDIL